MNPYLWAAALIAYAAFRAWYDNWRPPLSAAEVDGLMAKLAETPSAEANDLAILRRFLDEDDGREFVMLNLVKVAPGEVDDPATGGKVAGRTMLARYTGVFMPALIRRGGHPALVARKIGGYLDAWRVGPDPGWSVMGYMRYRSRRDMMSLVTDPAFAAAHPFKLAGTAETFSFPTRPTLMLFVGPRLWVALTIGLVAALAQIALLILQTR